jgi:hypothetical protein
MMRVLGKSGLRVVSLSPCFRDGVWKCEELLEQVQLNFSFRNKFIILNPCGLLVDNNTFSKMCVLKCLTGYTDYGGYVVKRNSAYIHIRVNDHIVAGRLVFVHA